MKFMKNMIAYSSLIAPGESSRENEPWPGSQRTSRENEKEEGFMLEERSRPDWLLYDIQAVIGIQCNRFLMDSQ